MRRRGRVGRGPDRDRRSGRRSRSGRRADAAGDAAAIAVRNAGPDGLSRSAARALAQETLAPTLGELADSAIALLDRMLPTETLAIPAATAAEPVFTTSV